MWFRYFAISLLKWIAVNVATIVAMFLVIPDTWRGFEISAPVWILTFAISVAFAYWALTKKVPNWKDVLKLMAVWLIVTMVLQNAFEYFMIGRAFFFLRSLESLVGMGVELLGIIVGAIFVRWRLAGKAKAIVG
jgi:hypothetical protein